MQQQIGKLERLGQAAISKTNCLSAHKAKKKKSWKTNMKNAVYWTWVPDTRCATEIKRTLAMVCVLYKKVQLHTEKKLALNGK